MAEEGEEERVGMQRGMAFVIAYHSYFEGNPCMYFRLYILRSL
jgi:hypothetical protein